MQQTTQQILERVQQLGRELTAKQEAVVHAGQAIAQAGEAIVQVGKMTKDLLDQQRHLLAALGEKVNELPPRGNASPKENG